MKISSPSRPSKDDLLAIAVILAGFGIVLLAMPIVHNFAIIDDWTYARNVERVVAGQGFAPSEYAQATLISHTYWGALFARLFGMNFTSLTAATVGMALAAALSFYALLRSLGYSPLLSGLGVGLLTLNPYFINLTYSFMTDITFLALLLLGCLFYFKGFAGFDSRWGYAWLLLGSLFASLAFLTRQFGLALPAAALLWLLAGRRWSWRGVAAVALLPALVAAGYYLWSRGFGPTFSSSVSREELFDLIRRPSVYATRAAHFVYLSMLLPGVLVPLYGRVRHWKIVTALALSVAEAVFLLWQVKQGQVEQGVGTLNELSYSWLTLSVPDPTLIYCLGAALTVWLAAGIAERAWPGFVLLLRRKRAPVAADFLYILAFILFVGTYFVSAGFLDRYWLPLLPFLIAAGLASLRGSSYLRRLFVVGVVAALGIYGSLVHLDMYAQVGTTWEAGRWLVSRGVPLDQIRVGYSWDGYHLHDAPRQRLGSLDITVVGRTFPPYLVSDPVYIVAETPQPGYTVLKRYTYLSMLGSFATKEIFVMQHSSPSSTR